MNLNPKTFYFPGGVTWVFSVVLVLFVIGCTGTRDNRFEAMGEPEEKASALTPGMAKATIKKGQTTQAEVMEIFGPPDYVTTHSSGGEMWGYDRVSREVASNAFGLGLLGGGLPGSALIGGIVGVRSETTTQTVRTIFLLIYFDKNDTVTDYKLSAARF